MKKFVFYPFMFLLIALASCDDVDDVPVPEVKPEIFGKIIGGVVQLDEYGVSSHAWGYSEKSNVMLMDSNRVVIRTVETEEEGFQDFTFDSLAVGTYYLVAEAPSFATCQNEFVVEITPEDTVAEVRIELKSKGFEATMNAFQADSLVGNRLYHSFDIDKDGGKTLGVRLYLSDQANVSNQNYVESLLNYSAWATANSGQYYLFLEIDPDLYQGDSIYVAAYLVNRESDECVGNNGLVYHFPFSEEYITVGIER